jgi:hypothetical protein
MVRILSAMCRASEVLLSWQRSMPEFTMWHWNNCQSAFCQDLQGFTHGGLRSRYRVQMACSELESSLISCAGTDWVMLVAEKHRSMTDGLLPLWGKCVGWPGLLSRKKL